MYLLHNHQSTEDVSESKFFGVLIISSNEDDRIYLDFNWRGLLVRLVYFYVKNFPLVEFIDRYQRC